MQEVVGDENRARALEEVKRNQGAPGTDRMTTTEYARRSTGWRDGFGGTSGNASGRGGTRLPGGSMRRGGWECIPGCSQRRARAEARGSWPLHRP